LNIEVLFSEYVAALKRDLRGKRYGYKDINNLKNFIRVQEIIEEYHQILFTVGI
jgi:hypothetical protein